MCCFWGHQLEKRRPAFSVCCCSCRLHLLLSFPERGLCNEFYVWLLLEVLKISPCCCVYSSSLLLLLLVFCYSYLWSSGFPSFFLVFSVKLKILVHVFTQTHVFIPLGKYRGYWIIFHVTIDKHLCRLTYIMMVTFTYTRGAKQESKSSFSEYRALPGTGGSPCKVVHSPAAGVWSLVLCSLLARNVVAFHMDLSLGLPRTWLAPKLEIQE